MQGEKLPTKAHPPPGSPVPPAPPPFWRWGLLSSWTCRDQENVRSQHSCVTWGRQPSALLDHCPSLGALSLSLSLEEAQRRLLRGGGHVETEHGPLETPPRGARSPPRGSGLPDPLLSTPLSSFAGRGSETTPSPPHSSAGWTSETRAAAGHPGETPPQPAAGQPLAVTSHARETECFSGVSPC